MTKQELVQINGNWYRWDDIAETMNDDIREAVHSSGVDGTEQFWDAYTERADGTDYDAEWLLSVIPVVSDPALDPASEEAK